MTPPTPEAKTIKPGRVAIVWRGDHAARQNATPANNRFHRIFEELQALGIHAEPAVFDEAFADDVRAQLLSVDGVLVWPAGPLPPRPRPPSGTSLTTVCSERLPR